MTLVGKRRNTGGAGGHVLVEQAGETTETREMVIDFRKKGTALQGEDVEKVEDEIPGCLQQPLAKLGV